MLGIKKPETVCSICRGTGEALIPIDDHGNAELVTCPSCRGTGLELAFFEKRKPKRPWKEAEAIETRERLKSLKVVEVKVNEYIQNEKRDRASTPRPKG